MSESSVPTTRARLIAYYLPQFHPIPENDEWWNPGFTEWTNAAKARPLFRGHYQPHVPADLGFYDLRLPEAREAQADMAREYGIGAFCYFHYYFSGKRLLERPFDEVLASGKPDFPFCLCWANQTWTSIWHGAADRVLIRQDYPGMEDHRRHLQSLLPAFFDNRYLKVDGKPLFVVYCPKDLPDSARVLDFWREMAVKEGLPGLFLVAEYHRADWDPKPHGFDAVVINNLWPWRYENAGWDHPARKIREKYCRMRGIPKVLDYADVVDSLITDPVQGIESFPCVFPNFDNTPRTGNNGIVLHGTNPERFRRHLRRALDRVKDAPPDRRIVFVKSWNEWAEGNHLEPDLKFGRGYLDVIREELA